MKLLNTLIYLGLKKFIYHLQGKTTLVELQLRALTWCLILSLAGPKSQEIFEKWIYKCQVDIFCDTLN